MTRVLKGAAARSSGQTRLPVREKAPAPTGATAPAGTSPAAPAWAVPVAATEPAGAYRVGDADAQAALEEARGGGFAQGMREAKRQAAEALERQAAAGRAAIAALEAGVERKLEDVERFAVAVAFEACASVLGDAAHDSGQVAAVVRRLLADASESALLRVQLSAADFETVQSAVRADPHSRHHLLAFEVDPALGSGACRVVSAHGQLETSLAVQLDVIRQSLLTAFADRPHGGGQ
jgi:flagellar biosynthesis/type III secretory pathway protein FliH